jgi:2-polyprenyl-6-methoxyphenol hydroxylase-like FAD-dependent oxidoreductase
VEIFERAPALLPVGTGVLLQPTGLDVLESLGLRAEAERFAARVDALHSRTHGGRVLLDLHYATLGANVTGRGMHRATLLTILVDALAEAGVPIRTGADVEAWHDDASGRWLLIDGRRTGPFDLVIVANGARSAARRWTSIRQRDTPYPWGALWSIVPDPDGLFPHRLSQIVDGTREMLGFLPTGTRADTPGSPPLVSLFWSLHKDRLAETRAAGLEPLTERILRLEPSAAPLLDVIDSIQRWSFAEYHDVVMQAWHTDRCVIMGDAAHAMSPQLGQGVNLALWDARTLAACLAAHTTLDVALPAYTRARRAHLAFYQRATRWLTPFFQSSIPGAAALRDATFPLLGALPPARRQMLRTMAGVKRGIVRRSLPLT